MTNKLTQHLSLDLVIKVGAIILSMAAGFIILRETVKTHVNDSVAHMTIEQQIEHSKVEDNTAEIAELNGAVNELEDVVESNVRGLGFLELEVGYIKDELVKQNMKLDRILEKLER